MRVYEERKESSKDEEVTKAGGGQRTEIRLRPGTSSAARAEGSDGRSKYA